MSLHHVKELLGHASISTTDTCLNATRIGLQEAMEKVDRYKKVTSSDQTGPRLPRNEEQSGDGKTLVH